MLLFLYLTVLFIISEAEFEAEWRMREHDLAGVLTAKELHRLRAIDRQALEEGRRTLFVPTFYALGWKNC